MAVTDEGRPATGMATTLGNGTDGERLQCSRWRAKPIAFDTSLGNMRRFTSLTVLEAFCGELFGTLCCSLEVLPMLHGVLVLFQGILLVLRGVK